MTDERYGLGTTRGQETAIFDNYDNYRAYYIDCQEDMWKIVDKLNETYKENNMLKNCLHECRDNKLFSRRELERENKNLSEENEELKTMNTFLEDENSQINNELKTRTALQHRLKEENERLNQLLDYADDLIQSHLSEHFIRQWRNFKTGHKEYNDFWEEKLKKHNELKEDDGMTAKRFVVEKYSVRDMSIDEKYVNSSYYIGDKGIAQSLCDLLNELHKEKEYWKGNACNNIGFINILLHELDIAQEKGYEVSDPFKKLMEKELIE